MHYFGPFTFLFPLLMAVVVGRVVSAAFRGRMRDRQDPRLQDQARGQQAVDAQAPPPGFESRVYALAYRLGGRLTVSDVVMETSLGTKHTEALLDRLVDEVRVRISVSEGGFVVYEFPEILERLRREGK